MDHDNKTDKEKLGKGLRIMVVCLVLMFLGPTTLHIALSNSEKPLYIPLLIIGLIICALAIVFLFLGINTIMNSMFKKRT